MDIAIYKDSTLSHKFIKLSFHTSLCVWLFCVIEARVITNKNKPD